MNTVLKIVLGLLVVAAIFLGYKIYQKQTLITAPVQQAPVTLPATTQKPSETKKVSVNSPDEEKLLKVVFTASTTQKEKDDFFSLANKLAVSGNELLIDSCKPSVVVFKTSKGGPLSVRNTGAVPQEIKFDDTHVYQIAVGKKIDIVDAFDKGQGFYGYGCKGAAGTVGIISFQAK